MASACKFGKVRRGPRKGQCRKAKARITKVYGAAAKAKRCKGNKGAAFKACMTSTLHGLGKHRRSKRR